MPAPARRGRLVPVEEWEERARQERAARLARFGAEDRGHLDTSLVPDTWDPRESAPHLAAQRAALVERMNSL